MYIFFFDKLPNNLNKKYDQEELLLKNPSGHLFVVKSLSWDDQIQLP